MRRSLSLLSMVPLALSGCSTVEPAGGAPMPLVAADGRQVGEVRAWQTAGGVSFRVTATGLPHGVHGLHVHAVGRCDPPDFAHAGDLPNVSVAANGVLAETVTLSGASLTAPSGTPGALLDNDGAALVLHAGADDYSTDPSGNSGARIACAVITRTAEMR